MKFEICKGYFKKGINNVIRIYSPLFIIVFVNPSRILLCYLLASYISCYHSLFTSFSILCTIIMRTLYFLWLINLKIEKKKKNK